MKKRYSFSSPERIKRNFEYKRVRKQGVFYRNGVFVLAIVKNGIERHRLGVSISSSKVRLSSRRNRIKRLIKEAFRLNKLELKNGPYDIVISIAKTPPYKVDYAIVEKKLKILLRRARVL